jgi:hypothetical protein
MIYELVKRDPAWQTMPWFVLVAAVVCACPASVSGFGAMVGFMSLIVAYPHVHATRFQAGLPIAGRDLFLARALSIMAMVWLPAMAGATAAAISSGHAAVAGRALLVAALCTPVGGVLQSIRVRELAGPRWIIFAACMVIPLAGVSLEHHRAGLLIPASCAVAGIALLARAWAVVPKSFELAPLKPRAGDGPARPASPARAASPRLAWLPVLRSVFTAQNSTMLLMLAFGMFGAQRLSLCFWMFILWLMARQNTLWLRPLPIRPRALLFATVAPFLLTLVVGYFCGLHFGRHPKPIPTIPIQVLDLGAALCWAVAVILLIELVDWRRLSRIPVKVRNSVGAVLMVVAFVGGLVFGPHGVDPLHLAVLRLAQALPNSVGVAVVLVAAVLTALWLALEKVFAEADCVGRPRPQKDEYFG